MVLAFGKDNYNLAPEELKELSKAVHNGDISVIMRAYESELKVRDPFSFFCRKDSGVALQ
jgi:hypothetical protein